MTNRNELKSVEGSEFEVCWVEAPNVVHGTAQRLVGEDKRVFVVDLNEVRELGSTVFHTSERAELVRAINDRFRF